MTRLVLIRHGQTPSNVDGILDTAFPGPGLTDLGARQAAAVPGALAGRPVDAIAVSTLTRTQHTAAPLAAERGLTPIVSADLREIEAAGVEGLRDEASVRAYVDTVAAWMTGDLARRMPGAETDGAAFLARYDAAIAAALRQAQGPERARGPETVVVVSHGAAIRVWTTARARGVDLAEAEHARLPNTGRIEVDGDPQSGWDLVSWIATPAGNVGLAAEAAADDPTGQAVED